MKTIDSKDLFNEKKLPIVAGGLVGLNKNIIVFGLHNSGKSTLVKAVCGTDKRFMTLDEEEVLSEEDGRKLLRKSKKLWCVGHQYPGQAQGVSDAFLAEFVKDMNLSKKNWVIIKILK